MTLTRCDLLFADRAVLIEGPTERLLMPEMIKKVDESLPEGTKLSSQYLSIMEVGGAYAHIFFKLLRFLNLRSLVITDLDIVGEDTKKCRVTEGTRSSNSCINKWYEAQKSETPGKDDLLKMSEQEKIDTNIRLAFQVPQTDDDACGRSFEDAFMLANPELFEISGSNEEQEIKAWAETQKVNKTEFALKYAIEETSWIVPLYIEEGLKWLVDDAIAECKKEKSIEITEDQASKEEREKKVRDILLNEQ